MKNGDFFALYIGCFGSQWQDRTRFAYVIYYLANKRRISWFTCIVMTLPWISFWYVTLSLIGYFLFLYGAVEIKIQP